MIIWRRHQKPCNSTDRSDSKCGCKIYQEYRVNGKRFRRTLKTRNWQKALATARRAELQGVGHKPTQDTGTPTIQQAGERYLEDARTRGVRQSTLYKFGLLFRQMQAFANDKGLVFVSDFGVDNLSQFRSSLPNKNLGMAKKWVEIKSFFKFARKRNWLHDNPADQLTPIKTTAPEIVPITDEEMTSILKTCKGRTRALILLMRWSGLRIRDAVTIRKDQIKNDRVVLRMAKTGETVSCPLPPVVLEALKKIETAGQFYFWNGVSQPKSVVGVYQKILQRVFVKAKTPRVYPHLFRHTFASHLLVSGASVETVQEFLGHSSVKITEKHYKHWIKARQERADHEARKAWKNLGHSLGTVARQAR